MKYLLKLLHINKIKKENMLNLFVTYFFLKILQKFDYFLGRKSLSNPWNGFWSFIEAKEKAYTKNKLKLFN